MKLRVDVDDPSAVDAYKGPGNHLIPFLKMENDTEYAEYLENQVWFRSAALKDEFVRLGIGNPFPGMLPLGT